jgi:protein-L-isoaspartate(D-aspartate) O-methyltransferase
MRQGSRQRGCCLAVDRGLGQGRAFALWSGQITPGRRARRDHHPARYLLSPMVFAKLAQLAGIGKTDRVLDVGAATGYSTAILARIGSAVVVLENDAGLTAVAKEALASLGIGNTVFVMGPLEAGAPESAPYDVIFINGRAGYLPEALLGQLAEGGRLVAVVGADAAAKAKCVCRIDGGFQEITAFDAGAPLLPGFEAKKAFVF